MHRLNFSTVFFNIWTVSILYYLYLSLVRQEILSYLPFKGSPKVVHVLFPVNTPVSPSALHFEQRKNKSELRKIRSFDRFISDVRLYLVVVIKKQKTIGFLKIVVWIACDFPLGSKSIVLLWKMERSRLDNCLHNFKKTFSLFLKGINEHVIYMSSSLNTATLWFRLWGPAGLTFSSSSGFFTKTADLYLKNCLDSSYKYALWSGARIQVWNNSEVSETGIKTPGGA